MGRFTAIKTMYMGLRLVGQFLSFQTFSVAGTTLEWMVCEIINARPIAFSSTHVHLHLAVLQN